MKPSEQNNENEILVEDRIIELLEKGPNLDPYELKERVFEYCPNGNLVTLAIDVLVKANIIETKLEGERDVYRLTPTWRDMYSLMKR